MDFGLTSELNWLWLEGVWSLGVAQLLGWHFGCYGVWSPRATWLLGWHLDRGGHVTNGLLLPVEIAALTRR